MVDSLLWLRSDAFWRNQNLRTSPETLAQSKMALLFFHHPPLRLSPLPRTAEIPGQKPPPNPSLSIGIPNITPKSLSAQFKKHIYAPKASPFTFSAMTDFDATGLDGEDGGGDEGSPWEGAVVYRRDASVTHLECCTTLERLGLGKLSTEVSRSRAAAMGIRLPTRRAKAADFGDSDTPVLVSLDVTRSKRKLKLDGIVRTVITLGCNRCAEPTAESVYSNFSFLLTENPIEETDEINMGVIYGDDKRSCFGSSNTEEGDETDIDMDDWLYFPSEEKEIDLSKHIRDIVHVEVTINAVCDPSCKGICLKCGTNLNKSRCSCDNIVTQDKAEYGPLKGLRKQMQQK